MHAERPTDLLYGPSSRRACPDADSTRLRLESDLLHAVETCGWAEVAGILEASRELVLAEESETKLLERAAAALPAPGAYPEVDYGHHLAGGKFGGTALGELPPSEVALELREALLDGRPLAPLSFGLPRALFANETHLAAGRLLATRTARWEESAPVDLDPDLGLAELFAVPEEERGKVWERSWESLVSATARCAYVDGGRQLGAQLRRLAAGPDLHARHPADAGVDVMHLCAEPASDLALCGRDLTGLEYAAPGEWIRRLERDEAIEAACGECRELGAGGIHPSFESPAHVLDGGDATAAAIGVGVRIRLEKWGETGVPADGEELRDRVARALHDAVVYWAALHLCEVESDLRWWRLAGPLLHTDPQLRGLARLPEMEEETAIMLLAAFAERGPAHSPLELARRRRESWQRSWSVLRELAGFGNPR